MKTQQDWLDQYALGTIKREEYIPIRKADIPNASPLPEILRASRKTQQALSQAPHYVRDARLSDKPAHFSDEVLQVLNRERDERETQRDYQRVITAHSSSSECDHKLYWSARAVKPHSELMPTEKEKDAARRKSRVWAQIRANANRL